MCIANSPFNFFSLSTLQRIFWSACFPVPPPRLSMTTRRVFSELAAPRLFSRPTTKHAARPLKSSFGYDLLDWINFDSGYAVATHYFHSSATHSTPAPQHLQVLWRPLHGAVGTLQ